MKYEEALEKAFKEIKPIQATERFELPSPEGFIEGIKTIITNFSTIASILKRPPEHIAKFLAKELASSFVIAQPRLILNRKLRLEKVNEKLQEYVKEYVICKQCGKPDTSLIKQDRLIMVHCMACGAKYVVPKI
ncbi:MAG: translation initiation factor IF-2 subunit beta [Candidatus Pacearchaeota archaeon]